MRVGRCVVDNFGSYSHCEIDFKGMGLTFISGPTGAGKSTVADFISFACFGITSKNGLADDVRKWGADLPTKVTLEVELRDGIIEITRIRGKNTQNDLYFVENGNNEIPKRGKDLNETQKLLGQRLGVDAELFLLSSYFSQFSETDRFFMAKPKDRRETLERITDLSLPVKLADRASEARKAAKKELEALENQLSRETGREEQIKRQLERATQDSASWEQQHERDLLEARSSRNAFEGQKAQKIDELVVRIESMAEQEKDDQALETEVIRLMTELDKLKELRSTQRILLLKSAELERLEYEYREVSRMPDICPTCSRPGAKDQHKQELSKIESQIQTIHKNYPDVEGELVKIQKKLDKEGALQKALLAAQKAQSDNFRLQDQIQSEIRALDALEKSTNPHASRLEQLEATQNPHVKQIGDLQDQIIAVGETIDRLETSVTEKTHRIASLSTVYDLSFALRGELLQNAVSQLERETNKNLSEYFEGVFRVSFALEGSDKLTVTISRDGRDVSYACLSGGERRQLVLSFWRALSKRAMEFSGTQISLAIMDEAFSGLDDELKGKAFRLLEDMSNDFESILVIDHSPSFQSAFSNVINVEKVGEVSVLESVTGAATSEAA